MKEPAPSLGDGRSFYDADFRLYVALPRSVTIDIMLYDGANGVHLTLETLSHVKMAAPNVRYVKIASQDPSLFILFAERVPDVLSIVGDDMMLLQGLSQGGQGSATAIGNILPRRISALHGFFLEADMDSVRQTAVFLAPITMMLSIPKNRLYRQIQIHPLQAIHLDLRARAFTT